MGRPEPFYVVLRLDRDLVPYVDSNYETEKYASLRVKHLLELDGVVGWKYLMTPPYLWHPEEPLGAYTRGRGIELIDYGPRELRRLSLRQAVEGAWDAWRGARADRGDLEEAAQDAPEALAELFEEHAGTLKLHPQGLP